MAYALGFILSMGIAVPAYIKKSLTLSGAVAAVVLGTLLYGFGDASIYVALIAFFVSSSALSKVSQLLAGTEFQKIEARLKKGGTRDHTQVIANGGVSLLMAIIFQITDMELFKLGAIIAFGCACSDTWASEIGILSKQQPVNIISRTPVPKGLSGGVTRLGLMASVAGALFIGIVYLITTALTKDFTATTIIDVLMITFFGTLGSLIDSVIGEKWQAKYFDQEHEITERKSEVLASGIKFINGDVVNFVSGLMATMVGMILLLLIGDL